MFTKAICVCGLLCAVSAASAREPPEGMWQLQLGGISYHISHDKGYNERNFGLAVEYQLLPSTALDVGFYRNSLGRNSRYVLAQIQPFELLSVKFGVTAGVIDGYKAHNGGFGKIIFPSFSKQFDHFGIYGIVVPPGLIAKEGVVFIGVKVPFKEIGRLFQ